MTQSEYDTPPSNSENDVDVDVVNDIDDAMPATPKPKRVKKPKEFYVNEAEFERELRNFYDTDVISPALADMIHKMLNGLAHRPNFINYTFRDEATGDALVNIMAALRDRKFKFGGSKPFSYFNAIAWNCWRNRIKREARRRHALAAYQEEVYGDMIASPGNYQDE